MNLRSVVSLVSIFSAAQLVIPAASLSFDSPLNKGIEDATVSILGTLGYDCQTASVGGILCKKCQADGNSQKCEAFLCDAVTKKCRKQSAKIPKLPNFNNGEDDASGGIQLP